jgi:hypothetical protein
MTTPVHARQIAERIDWLMELSRAHSASFCSPENHLARQRYLAEHNTQIIAMKCMDGRIHLPYVTQTPLGVIHPFRNLGGIFELGWPYLGDMLADTVQQAVSRGLREAHPDLASRMVARSAILHWPERKLQVCES